MIRSNRRVFLLLAVCMFCCVVACGCTRAAYTNKTPGTGHDDSLSILWWFGLWIVPAVLLLCDVPETVITATYRDSSWKVTGYREEPTGRVIPGSPKAAATWLVLYLAYWAFYGFWQTGPDPNTIAATKKEGTASEARVDPQRPVSRELLPPDQNPPIVPDRSPVAEKGKLTLLIDPKQTEVFLDDNLVKSMSPGTLELEVPVGKHEVRVRKNGYVSATKQVEIKSGMSEIVSIDLSPERATHSKRELARDYERKGMDRATRATSGKITPAKIEEIKAAIADFDKGIEADSGYAPNYDHRGMAYFNLRNWDMAISSLSDAIRLDDKNAEYLIHRAAVYQAKGDRVKAANDLKLAAKLK